jgi:transcriptional regulator with XRE-family HTH domain
MKFFVHVNTLIAALFREKREERKMTVMDVSQRLEISPAQYSDIESGMRGINGNMIIILSKTLHYELRALDNDINTLSYEFAKRQVPTVFIDINMFGILEQDEKYLTPEEIYEEIKKLRKKTG